MTATDTGTGTIDNDDNATVTIASASAAEGSSLSFTATLDKAVDGGLTATPGYTDVNATKGTDYTANTTALSFTGTANETQTFTVQTTQDTTVEEEETFTVTPTLSGLKTGVTAVTGAAGTGTINDDDGRIYLSATPSSVTEDGGAKTVTVTATSTHTYTAAKTITVTVGKDGDSAVEGTDYTTVADFTLTLPANSRSGTATFTLTPTNDTIIEDDETLSIDGSSGSLTVNGTSVTITDNEVDDIEIKVDVEPFLDTNPDKIAENDAAKKIKVTAGTKADANGVFPVFPLDREVNVTVGESTDSALEGTDYEDVAGFTVTIKANTSSGNKEFTLTPTDDTLVEGDEAITVKGSASGLKVTQATITITDDDTPAMTLAVDPANVSEGAGDTQVTVTASTGGVTFKADRTVTVSVGKSGDGATSGTDYDAVTDFDVTINKGDTSHTGTFTLKPTDDTLVEGDEAITVSGTTTGYDVTGASITLEDNDVAPAVNLSLNPSSVGEGDNPTEVTVTATFSNKSTYEADTTLTVSVGDSTDSATSGTDYTAVTAFDVTIAKGKGSGTATFTLTPTQDTLVEGNETITVSGTHAALTVNGTSMTLTDDDGAPAINLSVNPQSVAESAGDTTVAVTATFSNTSTYAADTKVTVSVGKSGTATSGTDYTAVTAFDVTIAKGKGSGSATFTLTPTQDTLVEGNETITVSGTVAAGVAAVASLTVNGTSITLTDDDTPNMTLAVDPASVGEGAGDTTVTVTASTGGVTFKADRTVTVTVGKSGDSATEGTDYKEVKDTFDITITKGDTSNTGTFTLKPTDDTLVEGDEAITVSGTTTDLTVADAGITLTDDDQADLALAVNPVSVAENAGATTVTVTASTGGATFTQAETVRVTVGREADSATSGTDYAAVAGFDVTIAAGQSSGTGTFDLTPTDDDLIEGDETISVAGTSGFGAATVPMTLTDDDRDSKNLEQPPIALTASPSSVSEGGGVRTITVTATVRDGKAFPAATTVTVSVGASGDSAVKGTDYATVADFGVTIAAEANSGSATFQLTPTDDTLIEGDEAITLSGSASDLKVDGTSVTITDDDTPNMTLAVNPASVSEGAGDTQVTVTASTGGVTFKAARTVTVTVGKSGDSATSGTDYAAVTAFDITIAKGQTSDAYTFTLTPTDDTLIEGNETITVSGTTTGLTVSDASITLTDNDKTPEVNLSVNPSSVSEGDNPTEVTVTATFSNTSTYLTDTTVTVSVGDGKDSATSGTDYTAVTAFNVTIAKGKSSGSATFTLTPTQDVLVEGNETITVSGTHAALTVNGTSMTLTDDDGAPAINLSVNPSSVAESAGDTTVTVTATFSTASTYKTDTTVTVSVGDSTDSAASGTDYTAVTAFDVTIAAKASSGSATFTLTPTQDTLVEGNETITVGGTVAAGGGLTVNPASITLTDDDTADLALAVNPASVAENAGKTTVTVTASTGGATFTQAETVRVTVGRKADSATSGTDYAAVAPFDVTITAGQSSGTGTFALTPTDDDLIEGDETISVAGTSGFGAATVPMTLTDDDRDSKNLEQPPIALSASPSSVSEGGGVQTITVTATVRDGKAFPSATTVTVSVGASGDSATLGTDYAVVANFTVTIAAGQTSGSASFTLTPTDDTLVEGNETITVSGTNATLTVDGTSLTLTDDDSVTSANLVINLSMTPASVAENAGATPVMVTATFSAAVTYTTDTPVTVTIGDSSDSAVSGTDYSAVTAFTVTIAAGQTSGSAPFTLTPIDDTLVEGNETITVSGTNATLTVNGTSVTLTDDDGDPAINLSVNPASVAEDAGATPVTVTASFSNSGTYATDTTVTVSVGDSADSATSGTDYAAVADFTVTIPAGQTSGSAPFTLTPTNDTLVEGNETITVSGTNATLTVNGTSVTLTDDDGDPAINLSVNPASVAEDAGATPITVTASFSNSGTYATDTTVTVSVGDSADSATSGTDYAAVADFTVTIPAGQTSGSASFTLTPTDDTLVEGNETISVDGTATSLTVNGTSLILSDDDSVTAANLVVNLSVDPATVAEDAGDTQVTVTATFSNSSTYATDTTVTVSIGDSADSATSGTDYAAVADFTVTIPAGASSGSAPFTLTPTDDTLAEGDETISVNGTATRLTVNGTSMTLTDDDSVVTPDSNDPADPAADPAINLSVNPASVAEDAGATQVTVTATFSPAVTYATDTPVTVSVGDSADSAASGTDYAAVTAFTVTIPAGASSGSTAFTLTPIDDTLVEGDETITVSGTNAALTVNGTHLTLSDDDDFATVTVSNARAVEGDTMTFTLTLDKATTGSFTVTPMYGDDTATAGVDYTPNTSPVAFAGQAGEQHTFTVATLKDKLVEPAETFGVSLGIVGPSGIRGRSGSGTIDSNDVVTVVAVIPQGDDDLPTTLHEAGGPRVMTARVWANGFTFSTAMTFAVRVGNGGGTAQEGVDYETVADFDVTIPAGATSATRDFTVTPIDDRIVEGDETIVLDGTLPGYEVEPSTLTILDDDTPAFSLAVAPTRVRESRRPDAGDGHGRDRRRHLPGGPQRGGYGQRRHRHCRRGLRPGGGLRPPHCERRRERRRDVHARPDRRRRGRGRRDHRGGRGGQRQHGGRPDRQRGRPGGRLRPGARIRGTGRRHRVAESPGCGQPRAAAARRPRHAGEQHRGAGRVRRLRRRAGDEPGESAGHARRVLRQRRDEPGAGPGRRRLPGAAARFTGGGSIRALQAEHPVGLRRLPDAVGPQR